ncbi:MAG: calcium-binding protein, partial [Rhodobacterales bacterium CG_4_9_14_3_um_filter_71_31]
GVVTLSEFQAAFPEATAEQFAAADGDGDGDGALTAAEFATLIGG